MIHYFENSPLSKIYSDFYTEGHIPSVAGHVVWINSAIKSRLSNLGNLSSLDNTIFNNLTSD